MRHRLVCVYVLRVFWAPDTEVDFGWVHVYFMGDYLWWMEERAIVYTFGDNLWRMDACAILGLDVALHFR